MPGRDVRRRKSYRARGKMRSQQLSNYHELRIAEMIGASVPLGEIRERLNLQPVQVQRHIANLKRKNPGEAWRYKRLLSDRNYHFAWRLNTVMNYLKAGLNAMEIENLMGFGRSNYKFYRDKIRETVKDPKILARLDREPEIRGLGVKYCREREGFVSLAILKASRKKPGVRALIRMSIRGAFGHLSPVTLKKILEDAWERRERFHGDEKRHEGWRIKEIQSLMEEKAEKWD